MEPMAAFCFFDSLNNAEAVVGRDEFKSILIFSPSTLRYVIPFSFTISELFFFRSAVILGSSMDEIPWETPSKREFATVAIFSDFSVTIPIAFVCSSSLVSNSEIFLAKGEL